MSLDQTLLRLLKRKEDYNKLAPSIPKDGLDEATHAIAESVGAFYKEFPDTRALDMDTFITWFHEFKHRTLSDDKRSLYGIALKQMREDVPSEMAGGMIERLATLDMATRLVGNVLRYNEGAEIDLTAETRSLLDEYDLRLQRQTKVPQVRVDFDQLMHEDAHGIGIKWRLNCMNKHLRPMVGGDALIVAMRPDKGKTTFMCSETSFWVPQMDAVWPGQDRNGLWMNNEGPGARIARRYYQSALGITIPAMVDLSNAGKLKPALHDALGTDLNRMRFFDVHDMWNHEVENIIKANNPGFVVFDMIDNIKFSGLAANNGQRTDQLLEEMYKWGRNIGVKHDCVVVFMSQLSGDAEGVPYPTQSQLKDSKTGKQGACDVIVTGGSVDGMENSRYIGTPKNKLKREGVSKDVRTEVTFDADTGRLEDSE